MTLLNKLHLYFKLFYFKLQYYFNFIIFYGKLLIIFQNITLFLLEHAIKVIHQRYSPGVQIFEQIYKNSENERKKQCFSQFQEF